MSADWFWSKNEFKKTSHDMLSIACFTPIKKQNCFKMLLFRFTLLPPPFRPQPSGLLFTGLSQSLLEDTKSTVIPVHTCS